MNENKRVTNLAKVIIEVIRDEVMDYHSLVTIKEAIEALNISKEWLEYKLRTDNGGESNG